MLRKCTAIGLAFVLVGCGSADEQKPSVSNSTAVATISGELSYPSDTIPDDIQVCAEAVDGGRLTCNADIAEKQGAKTYRLSLPAGTYLLFAQTSEYPKFRAYYSEAVECGLSANCNNHEPIKLYLKAGDIRAGVNPGDWYTPVEDDVEEPVSDTTKPADEVSGWAPSEAALIAEWYRANEDCRGGTGDEDSTWAACDKRDGPLQRRLDAAKICYGREGEFGYQMEMHRCEGSSLR